MGVFKTTLTHLVVAAFACFLTLSYNVGENAVDSLYNLSVGNVRSKLETHVLSFMKNNLEEASDDDLLTFATDNGLDVSPFTALLQESGKVDHLKEEREKKREKRERAEKKEREEKGKKIKEEKEKQKKEKEKEKEQDKPVLYDIDSDSEVVNPSILQTGHTPLNIEDLPIAKEPNAVPDYAAYEARADWPSSYPGLPNLRVNHCTLDRVRLEDLTYAEFQEKYVKAKRPVIFENAVELLGWRANERWATFDSFIRHYGHKTFPLMDETRLQEIEADEESGLRMKSAYRPTADSTVGEYLQWVVDVDDNEKKAYGRSMGGFIDPDVLNLGVDDEHEFLELTRDYSPPWIVDFDNLHTLLHDYLMRLDAPTSFSPRYMIFGPRGGGTTLHKDFWDTPFWNACVTGGKHWVIFSPDVVGRDMTRQELEEWESMANFLWFRKEYPKLTERGFPFDECTQRAGDILWSPGAWYHQTVNLKRSISVSENQITPTNFNEVYQKICFENFEAADGLSVMSITHSMYMCVALSQVAPDLYEQSCCSSREYLEYLDSFSCAGGTSIIDCISNSLYYNKLVRHASKAMVIGTRTPIKVNPFDEVRRQRGRPK